MIQVKIYVHKNIQSVFTITNSDTYFLNTKNSSDVLYYNYILTSNQYHLLSESGSGYGAMVLLALITILIDIGINIGDVATDFWYGWELFEQRKGKGKEYFFYYGIIVWIINWLPGVVATIYLLSMYRHKLGPKYALIYSIIMLLLYPIVPIMAFFFILWARPGMSDITVNSWSLKKGNHLKRSHSSDETTVSDYSSDSDTIRRKDKKDGSSISMESYKQFSDLAMLSYAISGGIESPLQFIFQVCNHIL